MTKPYSADAKYLIKQNIDALTRISDKLPIYDKIIQETLTLCDATNLNVEYEIAPHSVAEFMRDTNTIKINAHTFLDRDADEVKFCVAHEAGHYHYKHRYLPVIPIVTFSACSACCLRSNLGFLPLLGCSLGMIGGTILAVRYEELWCDRYAAKKVGPQGGIKFFNWANSQWKKGTWLQKLLNYDYSHPSAAFRVKVLQQFSR
jgi:hypothetical protein